MKTYNIPLESFIPKDKMKVKMENGELYIPADETTLGKNWHHIYVPGRFKPPFRIDMIVKANVQLVKRFDGAEIDGAEFTLKTGMGIIAFSGSNTRRTDIFTGDMKSSPNYEYDNDIPVNEYVDITVMYGSKMMWTAVNGKYCFSSDKMPYIKLLQDNAVPAALTDGLGITISNGKNTRLQVKSLTVTEFEINESDIPAEITYIPKLSPFEWIVRGLPSEVRDEVIKTNEYLLKDMKSSFKFKRSIDKYGYVSYMSPCGFRYRLCRFGIGELHELCWTKKPDLTVETLNKLAESSPEFADKMFSNLNEPITTGRICKAYADCNNVTAYTYKGVTKRICGGVMQFKWLLSEFEDVRKVVAAANEIVNAADENK